MNSRQDRDAGAKKRPYEQRARAEGVGRTTRRIAAAAAQLHATVGPAATTISAVAERAGVPRVTVYRHFPDEESLFRACQAHYLEQHPPPQAHWMGIDDPEERTRTALSALYRYFDETEDMTANLLRDATRVPALQDVLRGMHAFFDWLGDDLATAWQRRPTTKLRAIAGHAVSFTTWRSLCVEGSLGEGEAVDLMIVLLQHAAPRDDT
ncbi:MAG: TetR/AcrR family transcriptional regulator [Actinomycetota bacterium]